MVIDLDDMADDTSVTVPIEAPVGFEDSLDIQLTDEGGKEKAGPDVAVHEAGDIVFGDESVAEILVKKTAAEREQVDDEQIFNDLLLHFRKQPELVAGRKISVQLGQDLVVEPMDIQRLIKLVHRAMECVTSFPTENAGSKPLLAEALDENNCNYSQPWLRPLVFDRRVVLHATQGERSDADDNHTLERLSLQRHILDQAETQSRPQSYKQKNRPYSTDRLHELHRSAFAPSRTHALTNNATTRFGVPVLSYVHDKMGRRVPGLYSGVGHVDGSCTGATRPPSEWSFVQASPVYRIAENYPLSSLREEAVTFTIEQRMASHPVMQPRFDNDDTTFETHVVTLGEPIAIVGFVIHGSLGDANSVTVRNGITPTSSAACFRKHRTVVFAPDALTETLGAYIPTQLDILNHQQHVWNEVYNLGMVDECFGRFKLNFDSLAADVISRVRAVITRNIVDLIDTLLSRRERTERRLQKAASAEPSGSATPRRYLFLNNAIVQDRLEGRIDDDPIITMIRLAQVPDHGDECLLMLGLAHARSEGLVAVPEKIARPADAARDAVLGDISRLYTDITAREWGHMLEKADQSAAHSLKHFHDTLSREYSEGFRLRKVSAAQRGAMLRTKLREKAVMSLDLSRSYQVSDFVLRDEESGEGDEFVEDLHGAAVDSSFYSAAARTRIEKHLADRGIPNPSTMRELPTTALRRIADMFVVMMNPNKLNFIMSAQDLVRAVYNVSALFDEMDTEVTFVNEYNRTRLSPTATREERIALYEEAQLKFKEQIGRDTDVKTQRHASAIIARLLIELESHRPKHVFRQILKKGGRKTIGSDLDTQYEYYSEENKLNFLVQLASRTSDLGKDGRLLDRYQADDLKDVTSRVAVYVDMFHKKPDIEAAYAMAAEVDKRQEIVQRVNSQDRAPRGFECAAIFDGPTEVSLERLHAHAGGVQGNYRKLLAVQDSAGIQQRGLVMRLLKLVSDSVATSLAVEQGTDSRYNYDPYKYGSINGRDDVSDASGAWRCLPDQETCIVNTFADMRGPTDVLGSIRECAVIRRSLRARHSFLNVATRSGHYMVYSSDMAPRVVSASHSAHVGPLPTAPTGTSHSVENESVLKALHSLTSQLRNLTGRDATWEKYFSSLLTDKLAKRPWGFDNRAIKNSLLGLRRLVRLLASDMSLWMNNYRIDSRHISLKNYDATVRRREMIDVKLDVTDPAYINSASTNYLATFRSLSPALKTLGTSNLGGMSAGELSSLNDHEELLKSLLESLESVLHHIQEVDGTKLSLAAELVTQYVENCLRIDDFYAVASADDASDRKKEGRIRDDVLLTSREKSERYMRRLANLDGAHDDDDDVAEGLLDDEGAEGDNVFSNDDSYFADEDV